MNKNIQFTIILALIILCSSLVGWYSADLNLAENANTSENQKWSLPKRAGNNLTSLNYQLTQLKIWGQVQNKASTSQSQKWRLVGISNSNAQLVALIEIDNESSIKRVSTNGSITEHIKLLSIDENSIEISDDKGKVSTILLYP